MQNRQPKMFASGFAEELRLVPFRRLSPPSFSELINQVGASEVKHVLPEFAVHDIGGLVQLPYVLRS